jgi:outer membrane protein TolC
MFMFYRSVVLLCGLLLGATLWAEEPPVLTLPEAIQRALTYNIDLRQAQLQRTLDAYDITVTREQLSPKWQWQSQLNAWQNHPSHGAATTQTAAHTHLDMDYQLPWGTRVESQVGDQGASLEVRQPLLKNRGRVIHEASLFFSEERDRLSQIQLEQQKRTLITQVILYYRHVQQGQMKIAAKLDLSEQDKISVAHIDARIEAGRTPENDRIQAEFEVTRSLHGLTEAEQLLARAKQELGLLIGLPMHNTYQVEPFHTETLMLQPLNFYQEYAVTHHPDFQQLLVEASILDRERSLAENELKWDLNMLGRVSFDNGITSLSSSATPESQYFAGIEFKVPFGQTKTRKQALFKNKVAHERWHMQHQKVEQQLLKNVVEAWQEVQSLKRQLTLSEQSLVLARASLDATQQKFEAGRAASFELVAIQQQLQQAELQHIHAQIAYQNSVIWLQYASGMEEMKYAP